MNKTIAARRAVYRWLYQRRVDEPGVFFSPDEIKDAAVEPYLAAALAFGLETNHLEKKRGSWRMTALGMVHAEIEGYVKGEE